MLQFYNTLSRKKEQFKPLKGKEVRMYNCGPTVYNFAHLGNFRTYTSQDLLRRYLKFRGYKLKQVMNLTDVDDKTIHGAKAEKIPLKQFTDKYVKAFFEDMQSLGIEKPDIIALATEAIPEMVQMIEILLKKRFAYKGEDGSVYYNIRKFKDYGKLSKLQISKLKVGARVKQDEYSKENAQDFALWKAWSVEDGEVFWETSLGKGRPGWHIECSAMSTKFLGPSFDIHLGGIDLIFPHHENEIAQSEGATGKKFVKYWMHMEHLFVEGQKMAKSLHNFYTLRDVLAKGYSGREVRYLLLQGHYRQPLNFTWNGLEAARKSLKSWDEFVLRLQHASGKEDKELANSVKKTEKAFGEALDDDLNVSQMWASLFELQSKTNKNLDNGTVSEKDGKAVLKFLEKINTVLNIFRFERASTPIEIRALVKEREIARKSKNFKESDRLRVLIQEKGFAVSDTLQGPVVKKN